jgi:hypothetical protein
MAVAHRNIRLDGWWEIIASGIATASATAIASLSGLGAWLALRLLAPRGAAGQSFASIFSAATTWTRHRRAILMAR